jgi:hypothetical protein
MRKLYYLLFSLFFIPLSIFSQGINIWHESYLYNPVAFLNILLSNNYLNPGQTLYYNVTINYRDIYYLPNVSLVIQIIKVNDNNPIYPFQFTNDNEIYEYVVKNLYLQPGEALTIPLNYTISSDLSSGYYYIVAYLYTPLGNINGLPFIYYPGVYTKFYVNNPSGNYPTMYIVKNDTYISSGALYTWGSLLSSSGYYYSSLSGPTGYGVQNYINLTVDIYSSQNTNAVLKIIISPWDDILYSPVYEYEESVNLTGGNNIIEIPNTFVGNLTPNAYSLRIELISNNQVQSIYRLRFIVLGPTTRLDGVFLQGNGNLTFIVAPSPDHYTYPTTPNVVAQVYSNTLGFDKNISLGNISWYTTQFTYVNLQLPLNSSSFDLCINLYSNNILEYSYCTYYYINKNNIYGIPLSQLIYVNYTNNYFYICSNISGNLVISLNSLSNAIFSTNLYNSCYNYTFESNGTYYISFFSSQYSSEWTVEHIIYSPQQNYTTIKQTIQYKQSYNYSYILLLVSILIILLLIILFMRKKKIFLLIILPLILLYFIHSQNVEVTPNNVCYPADNVSIITQNFSGIVDVSYIFYNPNNISIIYSQGNYQYLNINLLNSIYVYNITLYNLTPGINQIIDYNITVENCTESKKLFVNCSYYNFTGSMNSSYPFYFEYYINPIYTGGDDAAYIIPGCQEAENLIDNTYFNFTVILPNVTSIVTRINCSGSGDPEWGQNLCDLYISNYDSNVGNYTFNGTYIFNNVLFNLSFIDNPLQVLSASNGGFTTTSCSHAGSDTSTNSNPLNISINYYGPNQGTNYTYNGSMYILAQNTTLAFNVNGGYNVLCSDGVTNSGTPAVAVWLYSTDHFNLNSLNYIIGLSNLGINFTNYNVDRKIIYIAYPKEGFVYSGLDWTSPVQGSSSIYLYNFSMNSAGYYIVYQDYIKTICNSPLSYICDPDGKLCNIRHIQGQAEGWLPINPEPGYYILVINPNATVNLQNVTYYPNISNTNPGDAINIGNINDVGVGNLTVNASWILPDPTNEYSSFLLPENTQLPIYIYFPTNECAHVDCQIPYNVSYQNAYGLTVYPVISYSGYVNIKWDNLSIYTNPSLTEVTYGEPSNITIAVENLGPVSAENISAYNIQYNPSCIQILNIYNISSLPSGETGNLNIEINITNLNCKPQDYNISFQVYGWNTYIYNYSLILPISYIINPPNGAQLQSQTLFNIYDINAQTCYIIFNNAPYNRNCNSQFIYQSSMCPGSICNTQIQSINNYAEFYQNYTYYNYLSNQTTIFGISLQSPVISLYVGQEADYNVLIKNLVPTTISCQLLPPITQTGKASVVGYSINGQYANKFNISPEGAALLNIYVVGIASGIDNLIFGISCNSSVYGSYSYTQSPIPVYVLTTGNVIANYTQTNIIVSEKINPISLISISVGILMGILLSSSSLI